MKKLIIIVAILTFNFQLFTLNCCAQPNAGFENWNTALTLQEPDSWQTFNFLALTSPPNDLSAFKATGIDKHSGNYALMLKTIFVHNNPSPQLIRDTMTGVFTGKIRLSPVSIKYGSPYTGRPEKLEFWAKYSPVGNDIGANVVFLLKWNGTGHDTIASGKVDIPPTTAYTLFEAALTYRLPGLPDSASILFSSSKYVTGARVGSTLFVDDVLFTGWVGIDESTMNAADKVQLFPNPAKDNLNILLWFQEADNVQVIDASGKLAGTYKIQNYTANINTSAFAGGIYFYEIRDKKNTVLTKGKFSVVK